MLIAILYTVGVFAVGFSFGVFVKAFLDNDEIHELEKQNRTLHRENARLKKETEHEVIEIVDKRVRDVQFGGF